MGSKSANGGPNLLVDMDRGSKSTGSKSTGTPAAVRYVMFLCMKLPLSTYIRDEINALIHQKYGILDSRHDQDLYPVLLSFPLIRERVFQQAI